MPRGRHRKTREHLEGAGWCGGSTRCRSTDGRSWSVEDLAFDTLVVPCIPSHGLSSLIGLAATSYPLTPTRNRAGAIRRSQVHRPCSACCKPLSGHLHIEQDHVGQRHTVPSHHMQDSPGGPAPPPFWRGGTAVVSRVDSLWSALPTSVEKHPAIVPLPRDCSAALQPPLSRAAEGGVRAQRCP